MSDMACVVCIFEEHRDFSIYTNFPQEHLCEIRYKHRNLQSCGCLHRKTCQESPEEGKGAIREFMLVVSKLSNNQIMPHDASQIRSCQYQEPQPNQIIIRYLPTSHTWNQYPDLDFQELSVNFSYTFLWTKTYFDSSYAYSVQSSAGERQTEFSALHSTVSVLLLYQNVTMAGYSQSGRQTGRLRFLSR